MARSLRAAGLLAGVAAVLAALGACTSGGSSAGPSPSPTTTGSPSVPAVAPAVAWASNLCGTTTDLSTALADLDESLTAAVDASDATDPQAYTVARTEVEARLGRVAGAGETLASQLTGAPAFTGAALRERREVEAAVDEVQDRADALRRSAGAVHDATTAAAVATAAKGLRASVTEATTRVEELTGVLATATTSSTDAVRSVFGKAPACVELAGSGG